MSIFSGSILEEIESLPIGTSIEKHLVYNAITGKEYVKWQFKHYSKSITMHNEDLYAGIQDYKKFLIRHGIS
jgi:hypothetical protein